VLGGRQATETTADDDHLPGSAHRATWRAVAVPTAWTNLMLVWFDMPTSYLPRLLSQRDVGRRPLSFQYSVAQFVLADLGSYAVFLGLETDCERDFHGDASDIRQRR
jgi:hypothetical protein